MKDIEEELNFIGLMINEYHEAYLDDKNKFDKFFNFVNKKDNFNCLNQKDFYKIWYTKSGMYNTEFVLKLTTTTSLYGFFKLNKISPLKIVKLVNEFKVELRKQKIKELNERRK